MCDNMTRMEQILSLNLAWMGYHILASKTSVSYFVPYNR